MKLKSCRRLFALAVAGSLIFSGILPTAFARAEEGAEATALDDSFGSDISNMFTTDQTIVDNTWLFAGGVETQGRFAEIGSARNYVGQFEEYIRWVKASTGSANSEICRQRYMINVGKKGQDIVAFEKKLDGYLESLKPKAVDYLVGREDYQKGAAGLTEFKEALESVILKSLAAKDDGGYAVIQLPHAVKDAKAMENIELYAGAVEEVVGGMDNALWSRIVVADHLSVTRDDDAFLDGDLNEDGLLNADGHYEFAKQLALATYKSIDAFQPFNKWETEPLPDAYLPELPTVTAGKNSLKVEMSEGAEGNDWNYILKVNETEITGAASGASFTIDGLRGRADYELAVRSGDGKVQYGTVYGAVKDGNRGTSAPALSRLQQVIADKVNDKDTPLTWLFMGDSITHAALWTDGYDGIAQIIEKYLKEDLGREDDIVINTGNSSATTLSTLNNIEQRLTKYTPDIVSVMLGTNDTQGAEQYGKNLEQIVSKIREVNENAAIIFRTPTPADDGYENKLANDRYLATMKQVAEDDGNILFIDQYSDWSREIEVFSYQHSNQFEFGNGLHPGAAGQLRMAQQFIRECGLNTGTRIANLAYKFPFTDMEGREEPKVTVFPNAILVSKGRNKGMHHDQMIGDIEVTATDQKTGRIYKKSSGVDGDEVYITDLPTDRIYRVDVKAKVAGANAENMMFRPVDVRLQSELHLDIRDGLYMERIVEKSVVGEFAFDQVSPENYTYTLCEGEGSDDNGLFRLDGSKLKVAQQLEYGNTYSVRVRATGGSGSPVERAIEIRMAPVTLDTVRRMAQSSFEEDGMALDLDLSDVAFDGTSYVNLADSADTHYAGGAYLDVLNNLVQNSTGGSIIYRFRADNAAGTILAAGSAADANDHNTMSVGLHDGMVRGHFRTASAACRGNLYPNGLADGNWHTVAFSFDTTKEDSWEQVLVSVDGGSNVYPPDWWTEDYKSWFSASSDAITQFTVGGTSMANSMGAFVGQIESLTITDQVFNEGELQKITGELPLPVLEQQVLMAEMEELEDLYEKSESLAPEDLERFKAAYDAAKEALGNKLSDIDGLTDLLSTLQERNVSLQKAELDRLQSNAEAALNRYKNVYEKEQNSYTKESWDKFAEAYRQVQSALRDGKDFDTLDALLGKLDAAFAGLVRKPPVQKPKALAAPAVSSVKMTATKKLLAVEIRVSKVVGADSYTVYRAQGGRATEIGKTNAGGVAYDYNPAAGKTVSYYAVADSSSASYTKSANGAPKSLKLAASTKKLAVKKVSGKTQVRVTWKKVKGAKQYLIYRSEKKDSGYKQVKAIKKANATSFIDKKVKKNKNYYYRLVVKGKQGLTGPKTSKVVKVKK